MRLTTALTSSALAGAVGVILSAGACLPFPLSLPSNTSEGAMDNETLETLIQDLSDEIEGQPGYWAFGFRERQVVVITDTAADRMRIMTPVTETSTLDAETANILLQANFDRALDARYALARGYLWSVFIHPLSPLTEAQFRDGVLQVVTLADNYGSSYSSGGLVFQGGQN